MTRHRHTRDATPAEPHPPRRAPFAAAAATALALALLAGCSSKRAFNYDRHLEPAPPAASKGQADPVAAPEPSPTPAMTERDALAGLDDVAVLTGPPGGAPAVPPPPVQPGGFTLGAGDASADANSQPVVATAAPAAAAPAAPPVLVDAVIGQINGRPVYASEFFAPMDAQLRAEARQFTERQWLLNTRRMINDALWRLIKDELLLAEFEASLTPEQRQGLFSFIRDIQSGLVRENYGSQTLARKRFEEAGGTFEEEVERRRDEELVRMQLRRAIADRLYVSWRDVQQEYERNPQKYNPPGVAQVRMIWVDGADAERLDRVAAALAADEGFADVASRESDFRRSEGGAMPPVALDAPTYAESTIFQVAALNDPARTLAPGETVGPFDYEGRQVWIHLESLEQNGRSLFDLQLEIYNDLFSQRFSEETERYLTELMERGVITAVHQMQDDLFRIAADLYLLQGR